MLADADDRLIRHLFAVATEGEHDPDGLRPLPEPVNESVYAELQIKDVPWADWRHVVINWADSPQTEGGLSLARALWEKESAEQLAQDLNLDLPVFLHNVADPALWRIEHVAYVVIGNIGSPTTLGGLLRGEHVIEPRAGDRDLGLVVVAVRKRPRLGPGQSMMADPDPGEDRAGRSGRVRRHPGGAGVNSVGRPGPGGGAGGRRRE